MHFRFRYYEIAGLESLCYLGAGTKKFQAIFMSWIVPFFSIGNLGRIKILYLAMHVVTLPLSLHFY